MKKYRIRMVGAMIATVLAQFAPAAIHYVDKGNAGATAPYTNRTTAAADIQTAINYASVGSTVMVYAATYDLGATLVYSCSNRVYIDKAISVRSVDNDRANTIIMGAWDPVTTNGPAAVRCVYMGAGSSLIGFTLTNGATANTGDHQSECGGGIFAHPSAIVSNCIIAGCAAYGNSANGVGGGGVCYGTYYDCDIIGNRVGPGRSIGGGAFDATLYRCLVAENVAEMGAGALRSTLYDCVVSNNTAIKTTSDWSTGGGIAGWSAALPSKAYGCTIIGNTADRGGGAGWFTTLSNCIIKLNSCPVTPGQFGFGGGVYQPISVTACTIISNTAPNGDGGYQGSYTNCIVAYCGIGLHLPTTAYNCLVYGCIYGVNVSAAYNLVEGCTIIGNTYGVSDYYGAKTYSVLNSILYSNGTDWFARTGAAFAFTNTCTTPAYPGWDASNITNNPRFVEVGSGFGASHVPGNYRLRGDSPCINAGSTASWMIGLRDLDGNPRLDKMSGIVDMGAYEAVYAGTIILIR